MEGAHVAPLDNSSELGTNPNRGMMKNWHDELDALLVKWGFHRVSEITDDVAIFMNVTLRAAVTYDHTGDVGMIVRRDGNVVSCSVSGAEVLDARAVGTPTLEHHEVARKFMSALGAFLGVARTDTVSALKTLVGNPVARGA